MFNLFSLTAFFANVVFRVVGGDRRPLTFFKKRFTKGTF